MSIKAALLVVGLCVPFILLTLWAVMSASRREFGSIEKKAAWIFVAAIPFVGFIIYIIFGLKQGKKPEHIGLSAK